MKKLILSLVLLGFVAGSVPIVFAQDDDEYYNDDDSTQEDEDRTQDEEED